MGQGRVTVRDAATYLGISESAVRNRLSRGTLDGVKVGGVTYVVLDTNIDDIPPTDAPTDYRDELITVLREQLEAEREANRENRRIIMQQAQNLAAIEAPPQTPQEAESVAESASEGADEGEGAAEPTAAQGVFPDTGADDRRPWWRRIFGNS